MSFHNAALTSKFNTTLTGINTSLVVFCNLRQIAFQTSVCLQSNRRMAGFGLYTPKNNANVRKEGYKTTL